MIPTIPHISNLTIKSVMVTHCIFMFLHQRQSQQQEPLCFWVVPLSIPSFPQTRYLKTPGRNFFKSGTNVDLGSRMNFLESGLSKVKRHWYGNIDIISHRCLLGDNNFYPKGQLHNMKRKKKPKQTKLFGHSSGTEGKIVTIFHSWLDTFDSKVIQNGFLVNLMNEWIGPFQISHTCLTGTIQQVNNT